MKMIQARTLRKEPKNVVKKWNAIRNKPDVYSTDKIGK